MTDVDKLVAWAERDRVSLSESAENVLKVEGAPSDELLKALGLHKIGLLSELWRREHWGKDYAKNWRRYCLQEWASFQPVSYKMDPREDLSRDHTPWHCILQITEGEPQGLLHGIRCLGAALEREGTAWRLSHGQIDEQEYRELRSVYLLPVKAALLAALDSLSEWRQWHELLTGSDWRPVLEPEDIETSGLSRLWFERKEGGLLSIS